MSARGHLLEDAICYEMQEEAAELVRHLRRDGFAIRARASTVYLQPRDRAGPDIVRAIEICMPKSLRRSERRGRCCACWRGSTDSRILNGKSRQRR
jgi:hypothetical protein